MRHGKVARAEKVGERAVRFDHIEGLRVEDVSGLPGVTSVKEDGGEVLLYTRDVGPTIGALLALTEARGLEPQNLAIRRATLEDVFLDLTGRALRD